MRAVHGLILVALVVLAGCSGLPGSGTDAPGTTIAETDGAGDRTTGDDTDGSPDRSTNALADPGTDRIGWEDGYWANESLSVTNADGLNESERAAVVARSMARVEVIRDQEFESSVPVEIISREEFLAESRPDYTESLRTFDNAKFEALFFVGEDRDSIAVQRANRGENVLGYYDPRNDTIKLVADGGQPTLASERTLGHELVHAMQDQSHNLSAITAETRDERNGQTALIEGEARTVGAAYGNRCGSEWDCVSAPRSPPSDLHLGIYMLNYFPYDDGPGLVAALRDQGDWGAVDDAFEDPPESAEQVIYPDRYTPPRDDVESVTIADDTSDGWTRVRPEATSAATERADYGRVGQSGLSAMFAYPALDGSGESVLPRSAVLDADPSVQFEYDLSVTRGWEGDRLHVYENADAGADETAYVWRLTWDSPAEAAEFADGYRALLRYNGASRVEGNENVFRIPDDRSFGDAFAVRTDGETVTVVNAPTVEDLDAVHQP
ncbi:Hvo_1808 family surface protein [Halorientalis halophila]|uniref:Hvo_1808 family surface protein n=1 Tax=Halorientalis halophila TaxID=3108499 RepID=UPI0030092433